MPMIKGNLLAPKVQKQALARFVNRFTKDHKPAWSDGYAVQFASDADWLANTTFHVTVRGELDERYSHCESSPTWPDGKP